MFLTIATSITAVQADSRLYIRARPGIATFQPLLFNAHQMR